MIIENIAYNLANRFKAKHNLGNYCGKTIFNIVDKLNIDNIRGIKLIRRPFNNEMLAGFIAYKYNSFIITTNTNKTIGNERFTIAHEIYHLLENSSDIIEKKFLEELVEPTDISTTDSKEKMANCFAAELLMPSEDVKREFGRLTERKTEIDYAIIINLQQLYGVDYIAMTRRLYEIGLITDQKVIRNLESLAEDKEKLMNLTLKLGFDNEVNTASKIHYISNQYLEMLKTNFDNKLISYDDLVRIFDYLGSEPEKFGYKKHGELSDEAKNFMESL